MMYSTYDRDSGHIISTITDRRLAGGLPVIAGSWSPSDYYVKGGRAHRYPPKPGAGWWSWDNQTESWQYDTTQADQALRKQRERALAMVDRVNPLWWASLDPERQAQLVAYRQALLDLPEQPGWPQTVEWPQRPPWL